ncbi:hypothetical protein Y717_29535 [Streptomyces scopuliridis RB72]|uniref:Uncharacterized protein n=1 Tax=Streptomyces scopuliridis RB72 TaxID=1440053 RepID=A0A2T7T5W2_9ACTN|nr:hypothetical protein Y717_29535 [Streptomyces scopuliridis RB72]
MHDEFLCHVTAYGISGGQRIGVPLGTYRAPTLALALWWLRDRATWIAERLDPSPESEHFPAAALTPVAQSVPDVPTTLRTWRDDTAHQDMVAEHLAAGRLIRVATRDDTTEYELLAESVDALRMDRALPALITPEALPEPLRRERPLVASAPASAHEYRGHGGDPGRRIGGDDSFGDTLEFGRIYR